MNHWFTWALGSAFFAGLTAFFSKVGVENINSHWATAIRTTVILFFVWGVAFFTSPASMGSFSLRTWTFLVLSGLATGASWLCYFRSLQLGDISKVAPVDKLSVVVAIVLAVAFLGERLSFRDCVGSLLIVAGSIVLIWK